MSEGSLIHSGESVGIGGPPQAPVAAATPSRFHLGIKNIWVADVTVDLANNATVNTGVDTAVTIAGVALGDLVFMTPVDGVPDPAGTDVVWVAFASAADTVKFRIHIGATARDLASQTFRIVVFDIT